MLRISVSATTLRGAAGLLLAATMGLAWGQAPSPPVPTAPATDPTVPCDQQAQPATCLLRLDLPQEAGQLAYYASRRPAAAAAAGPDTALLVMHGYPRDAAHSFNAGLAAVRAAGLQDRVLVVAPLFQVAAAAAPRCRTPGEMPAQPADALWRCGTWLAGEASTGPHPITSFAALDALVAALVQQWPSLRTVTLAGFSAGAQLLQRHAAFGAAAAPGGVRLRHVVADPGTWLYFDPVRPQLQRNGRAVADASDCGPAAGYPAACTVAMQTPDPAACPRYDRWKYGVADLPVSLGRDAATARAQYRAADLAYLAGALDSGPGRGTADKLLDHGCAAQLQGAYRLQRAQGYAAYDQQVLQPAQRRRLTVVPGCAHDVGCVLPSNAARPVLFDSARQARMHPQPPQVPPMKILVLGAGAIGSYYGARLLQAGASVSFLVRSARARQLRQDGLRVHSELGDYAGPVDAVEVGAALPQADVVLLACKAYDLQDAARSIAPAVGPHTAILPFLNGLQTYDLLDAMFGKAQVLGGVAYVAVMLQADGSTRQLGTADRVVLGARTPHLQPLAEDLYALLARSPGQRTVDAGIEQQLWNKWVMLCSGAAVTCLFRGSIAQILATAHGRTLVEAALDECLQVSRAEGFALAPGEAQQIRGLLLNPASTWKASMMRDIDNRMAKLEADAIVGDMLVRAARHGVAAPTLQAAYAHLQVYLQQAAA